jgi:ABC-type multidrug transport system ATPase subunit
MTTAPDLDANPVSPLPSGDAGVAVALRAVCVRHAGDPVLHDVNLTIDRGELVAIAGPSGAGKTTLLRTIGGMCRPSAGTVAVGNAGVGADRRPLGYVPQDDIVHLDLPLERVLHHAAALRTTGDAAQRQRRIETVLSTLGIDDRRHVVVRRLSGGERKRASIAVELLSGPDLFLLDEPTSGLDPAASATLIAHLRRLTDAGSTVMMTTHAPADLERCDRIVFLGTAGQVVFAGSAAAARNHFGVDDLSAVYGLLEQCGAVEAARTGRRQSCHAGCGEAAPVVETPPRRQRPDAGRSVRQWWALTCRNADLLVSNRLTLAILLGSPALVTMMIATLFPAGVFAGPGSALAVQQVYWITFAGFFFGLTAGLLQIAVETPIVRRDRVAGVGVGVYVSSKVAVLTPFLLAVTVAMLATLRLLGRLPSLDAASWVHLTVTVGLVAVAALSIGLLASAAVTDTTQATLALPMICFPQVLFAGALVATDDMTWTGRALSILLATRWGFESIGRGLGVGDTIQSDSGLQRFMPALSGSPFVGWGGLVTIAMLALIGTYLVVRCRTAPRS